MFCSPFTLEFSCGLRSTCAKTGCGSLLVLGARSRTRRYEQSESFGWDAQGRVHSDVGRETGALERQRPAFRRLGNVSREGVARGSESAVRIAIERLVRTVDPALE